MLNYRHLYYFWVVANEGGFARAAERLDMAIQTISAQVRLLESSIGHQLLKPSGELWFLPMQAVPYFCVRMKYSC